MNVYGKMFGVAFGYQFSPCITRIGEEAGWVDSEECNHTFHSFIINSENDGANFIIINFIMIITYDF